VTINKFRSILYTVAKYLGDVQALTSPRKGSIIRRIQRRLLGRIAGKLIGKVVK